MSTRRLLLVGLLGAVSTAATAQTPAPRRMTGSVVGDGRVHAPDSIEIGFAPLRTKELTAINVHPLKGAMLRFPYLVKDPALADNGTFGVRKYANTVLVWPTKCLQGCTTTLFVYLDDGELTPVPFLLVVDTTRPPTILRDFTDPVAARMRVRDGELATLLEQRADSVVAARLEGELDRCVASGLGFRTVQLANAWKRAETGESIGITAHDVGYSGACLARPKLYVRYTLHNATYDAIDSVTWQPVVRRANASVATGRPVPILADRRAPMRVPPMRQVRGELQLDGSLALEAGEQLVLTAVIGGHRIDVGTILTAPEGTRP